MFEWLKKKTPPPKADAPPAAPRVPGSPSVAKYKVGDHVRVIVNEHNIRQREGRVESVQWHPEREKHVYFLRWGDKRHEKGYFAEDLEPRPRPACGCAHASVSSSAELQLHGEVQDTQCDAWNKLLELIDYAAANDAEEFAPGRDIGPDFYYDIVTLPPTIAKLKRVKKLALCRSAIVRLPPEIGEMSALEWFDPYTSYRLHWFPYEITRCRNLKDSRVSTRALYANYKHRMAFPDLGAGGLRIYGPELLPSRPGVCSVCAKPFEKPEDVYRLVWTSRLVATDVLPLLVHACSQRCVDALPDSPDGYIRRPHTGGSSLVQPKFR